MSEEIYKAPHYNQGGVECIEALESMLGKEGMVAFLRGQIVKYLWRGPHKEAEVKDYKKASYYLDRLVELCDDTEKR